MLNWRLVDFVCGLIMPLLLIPVCLVSAVDHRELSVMVIPNGSWTYIGNERGEKLLILAKNERLCISIIPCAFCSYHMK